MIKETPAIKAERLQREFQASKLEQQRQHEAGIRKIRDKEAKQRKHRIDNQAPFKQTEVNSMNTRVIPPAPKAEPTTEKGPALAEKAIPAATKPAAKKKTAAKKK